MASHGGRHAFTSTVAGVRLSTAVTSYLHGVARWVQTRVERRVRNFCARAFGGRRTQSGWPLGVDFLVFEADAHAWHVKGCDEITESQGAE